ncbi:MAG: PD-(D/E)XK nuclease family protein, partial [Planctomycetes bacterium]|nr:PD-(D/E)XK nuclease family protein [Planctomycetota bacterium]
IIQGIPDLVLETNESSVIIDIKYMRRAPAASAKELIKNGHVQFLIYPLFYPVKGKTFSYINVKTFMEYPDMNLIEKSYPLSLRSKNDWRKSAYALIPDISSNSEYFDKILSGLESSEFIIKDKADIGSKPCFYCEYKTACHRNIYNTRFKSDGFFNNLIKDTEEESGEDSE